VLAASLPRQNHVYRTTDESFRFHNKKFDEMRCKLDSTDNPRFLDIPNFTLKPVSPMNRDKSGKIGHFQTFEI